MRRAELAYTSPCVHLRLTQCHNLKPVQTKYCWASYVAGSKFALPPRSKVAYYDVTPRAEHKALSTMMMEQFVRQVQTGRLRVAVVTLHGVRRRKLARRVGSEHRLQHKNKHSAQELVVWFGPGDEKLPWLFLTQEVGARLCTQEELEADEAAGQPLLSCGTWISLVKKWEVDWWTA